MLLDIDLTYINFTLEIIKMKNDMTFEQWFSQVSSALELHHDINHPSNRDYDYIGAYYSGVPIPRNGEMLPSKYKGELNTSSTGMILSLNQSLKHI